VNRCRLLPLAKTLALLNYRDHLNVMQAQIDKKTEPKLASAYEIVDPQQSVWDLKDVPNINPDFIAGLNCEYNGIQSFLNGGEGFGGPPLVDVDPRVSSTQRSPAV